MRCPIPRCSKGIAFFTLQRGALPATVVSRTAFRAPNTALLSCDGKRECGRGPTHSRAISTSRSAAAEEREREPKSEMPEEKEHEVVARPC